MLSKETLKKLQLEQEKLDNFIWENYCKRNNLPTSENVGKNKDSFIRTKVALLVEIGELANELKTFKHWKSQKDINWDKAKEELIDCLHFYLSWANSFEIDFSDYKFRKLVTDPDYNELLLAFFSETDSFNFYVPWKVLKSRMLTNYEKSWEDGISKLNPTDNDYERNVKLFREIKEKSKKDVEKMSSGFLEEIEIEKNRTSSYRWLMIFEELAQKMGMDEKSIKEEYIKKNKKNWERQQEKY